MKAKAECPVCYSPVSTKPIKQWKYRAFDVRFYECEKCKNRFKVYESPGLVYTIPKRR
jgi:transcriptional regulator NrdR family protein